MSDRAYDSELSCGMSSWPFGVRKAEWPVTMPASQRCRLGKKNGTVNKALQKANRRDKVLLSGLKFVVFLSRRLLFQCIPWP